MKIVPLGRVERVPLPEPCPVCGCRSHQRDYHGELCSLDGEVLTADEWRARLLDAS